MIMMPYNCPSHHCSSQAMQTSGTPQVDAFQKASAYLAPDAVIYVRTGSRSETYDATTSALSVVFPNHRLVAEQRPYLRPTQTRLFGDHEPKAGEVDLVLRAQ